MKITKKEMIEGAFAGGILLFIIVFGLLPGVYHFWLMVICALIILFLTIFTWCVHGKSSDE